MNNNDKGKIALLVTIIVFIIILIIGFVFIAVLDLSQNKEAGNISTTTRRTYKTTSTTSRVTTSELPVVTTTIASEKTTTSTTTTKKTTSKTTKTTTKKITTTKVTTTESPESDVIPIPSSRETTTEPTTYPDSVDAWEWAIVDYINEERARNGLNVLEVAKDLRQLAEEAADLWLGYGDAVVKEYLYGNSNYRMYSNLGGETPYTLYQRTINATKVTTDPYLSYLGVGVLLKSRGESGLPTYYYVIIYE